MSLIATLLIARGAPEQAERSCKECMILLDGKTVYACTVRLEAREMRLEPLRNKKLVRDLAVEIAPPDERITTCGELVIEP